jgi:transposase
MSHQHPFYHVPTDMMHLPRWMNAHTTPQALAMRARIVVTAHTHPTWNSRAIAQSLGVSDRLVRKWRQRWEETHCLSDLPRSGAPRRFSSEVRAQVTALACSLPRSHGVPLAHWSRAELARHLTTIPALPPISASTIGRWLLAEQIRPWRFHSWQHIQDQESFLQRARPVLHLYEQAQSLLQDGTWVVCADEKTSIQAREAEQAPCPPIPKHVLHQSPRYHRRGALHLLAALSVADGVVYGHCASRKRFIDFRTFVQTVLIEEARRRGVHTLALILDNGPTHAPKQLARWQHELTTTLKGKLVLQVYWLPKNASWLDQIEIWFSLLQRKLLQPNHFTSTGELQQAILDFIAHYNQTAKPLKWSYTVEQLEHKLGTNL